MAETPFVIGADARCVDGVCGKVTRVVVDPVARAVTYLVVQPRNWPGLGRLVPLDLVDGATPKEVRLRCARAEFDELRFAEDTDFVPRASLDQYAGYSAEQMLMLPYYGRVVGEDMPQAREDESTGAYGSLPPGEVGVRRDKPVYATDGEIGRVEGLVIDPGSHHVSHVLLQEGHLFGRREVAIPIGAVTGVLDSVQLNITKQQVENLPPVKRWSVTMDSDVRTRDRVAEHWHASERGDIEAEHAIYATDAILDYPQSGERFRGRANIQAQRGGHPAKRHFTIRRISGIGDLWVSECIITYDGVPSFSVSIMEFTKGYVTHETQYFGDKFEAASWRAPLAEPIPADGGEPGEPARG